MSLKNLHDAISTMSINEHRNYTQNRQTELSEREKLAEMRETNRILREEIESLKEQNKERKQEAERDFEINKRRYRTTTAISIASVLIALGSMIAAIIALLN